jgi:hypothetical protein
MDTENLSLGPRTWCQPVAEALKYCIIKQYINPADVATAFF